MAEQMVPAAGSASVNANGGVDTGGSRAWVWCQDSVTGHRYDVPATSLPADGLTVVDGYPLNFKNAARPAKSRTSWESDPDEPATAQATPAGATGPVVVAKNAKGGQA